MSSEHILYEVRDGFAVLRLNRPEAMNAMSRDMVEAFLSHLRSMKENENVRALVVTGSGRAFCAGADLKDPMMGFDLPREQRSEGCKTNLGWINDFIRELRALPIPKIAAVNGVAAGGGVGIALAADLVVAARSASFAVSFTPQLGLVPDVGCTWHLARRLGPARATGLTLLGERLSAEKAAELGLIWKCVDDDRLGEEAETMARRLGGGPTRAQAETVALIENALSASFDDQLDAERDAQSRMVLTDDVGEAMAAFQEKRAPRFKGR